MRPDQWEFVVSDALCSLRTLLCTAINCTPHERMFGFARRTMTGKALPSWLIESDKVYARQHVRNKGEPLGEEVTLLEANPQYALVEYPNGRQTTISIKDLAPLPQAIDIDAETFDTVQNDDSASNDNPTIELHEQNQPDKCIKSEEVMTDENLTPEMTHENLTPLTPTSNQEQWTIVTRKSSRKRTTPDRLNYESFK